MRKGIKFSISTTDFEEAIDCIERNFDIFDKEGWEKVKKLKSFEELSSFLTSMDVDNETFEININ